MISKGHSKTAFEKEWLNTVVEYANESDFLSDMYGHITSDYSRFEVDHILGAKTKRKINGVSWRVGELAIMPIPFELHNVMNNNPCNRTTNPGKYRSVFGHEKLVWLAMIRAMQNDGCEIPFSESVIQAIIR